MAGEYPREAGVGTRFVDPRNSQANTASTRNTTHAVATAPIA